MANDFRLENSIDKHSPIPAYQQITDDMIHRISQDEWDIGDRMPSEKDLAEYYGVSRVTLRQAMAQLESANLIAKKQGRGIFVTTKPMIHTQNIRFPNFSPEDKSGRSIVSKDIGIDMVTTAPRYIWKHLQVDAPSPLYHLRRLFVTDDKVIGLNRAWLPAALVPDFDVDRLLNSSISQTLTQTYHHEITKIDNYVESITLNLSDANLLGTTYGTTALKIDSIHYLESGTPVEYAHTLWLTEYTRLHFSVSK